MEQQCPRGLRHVQTSVMMMVMLNLPDRLMYEKPYRFSQRLNSVKIRSGIIGNNGIWHDLLAPKTDRKHSSR